MKKAISYVVFGIFSFLVVGCHNGYEETDGKIYHKWFHGGNWTRERTLVKGADASTFTTIENDLDMDIGKDKNHVFIDAKILKYANPSTFEQVSQYYWKDEENVFLIRFGEIDARIKTADPKTFVVINNLWAKDKNYVYYKFERLYNANPGKFVAINENWGKDESFYYWNNFRVDSVDYKSAKIVSEYYIKDKNNVFFQNKLLKEANPLTFQAVGAGHFGHDDKNMFDWDKIVGPITEEYRNRYISAK